MMISMLSFVGGMSWDPHIRGALTVLVGVVVLMGSIYLILATNSGTRMGFLIVGAGFFGWMFLMGILWWVYGLGWVGSNPSWEVREVVVGELGASSVNVVTELPELSDVPELRDAILNPEEAVDEDGLPITPEAVAAELDLKGWRYLPPSLAGDAQAAADAFLTSDDAIGFDSVADYLPVAAFDIGGKDKRVGDSNVERVKWKITSAAQIMHPDHWAVVKVQAVTPQEALPGEAPPIPMVDEDAEVVAVVMIRDIGNKRLRPAMVTIASLIAFMGFLLALHWKDQDEFDARKAFEDAS